ncbi:MAG: hypothetical protein NVSMB51_12610 [Solirubrobacteraceae bacterium]
MRVAASAALAAAALLAGCGGADTKRSVRHPAAPAPRLSRPQRLQAERESAAIDGLLRRTPYISRGGPKREIALTFDDGPGPAPPRLLRLPRRLRAPATFFQIGRAVGEMPALARRELAAGYPVGDHTQTHPFLKTLAAEAQRSQILGAATRIRGYGAPYPRLFRPPFGSFNAATLATLHEARMLMVLWSVDTRDFGRPGTQRIVYTAISGARPGAIILMHDGGGPRGQTLAALPRIVRGLRRRHYQLVTVPQMVLRNPPRGRQPRPRDLSGR